MKLMQLKRRPRRWLSFELTASAEHWDALTETQVCEVLDQVAALYTDHLINRVVEPLGPPQFFTIPWLGQATHFRDYLVRYDLYEQLPAPAIPRHIGEAASFVLEVPRDA
jgi:hypothetical protein